MLRPASKLIAMVVLLGLVGCSSHPPMKTVDYIDLSRYMGDWYVIANIPTFIEQDAYNAVERYELSDDGSIATTFTFNKGSYDGPEKIYRPTGYIVDRKSNALWGMQFLWPVKGDFRIVYLDDDYQNTIIGRQARDYVWIMSRQPQISDEQYEKLRRVVISLGYDERKLQKVPQKWDRTAEDEAG